MKGIQILLSKYKIDWVKYVLFLKYNILQK